jgi:FtsP/CotA-like multicopper oxidase with cupredoxin domain
MNRRQFIQLSTTAGFASLLFGCGGGSSSPPVSAQPYNPLYIPSIIDATADGSSVALSLHTSSRSFLSGKATPTYAISPSGQNLAYMGATLRLRNGNSLSLAVTNNLAETSALHWHGLHVPSAADGGPHQPINAGGTWNTGFTINQKASTNWYHSHQLGKTGEQVYRGLAGLIIVDDAESDALSLPKTYGVDDIPLIIQDRRFNTDGSFAYLTSMQDQMQGMLGDVFMVNGTVNPTLTVEAKPTRFRILNGSNARVYDIRMGSGTSFVQIATDGALLTSAVNLTQFTLSPAERSEIVVDFTGLAGTFTLEDGRSGNKLLTITVVPATSTPLTLPSTLINSLVYDTPPASVTRSFSLAMSGMSFVINGQMMDMNRIDAALTLNTVEVWEIINAESSMYHSFHIHGGHFYILERDGSAAGIYAWEKGHKDTVFLPPSGRVKIVLKMTDYTANASNPYMFHCHILEHEDGGMMGQFTVS